MARILLINDEPDLLEMCEAVLKSAGHAVLRLVTPTGPTELASAARWHPEVVLLDLVMPRQTGEHLLRKLRKMQGTAEVPVIVMSALVGAEDRADEMGAVACLEKPFGPDALLAAVDTALAESRHTATRPRYSVAKSRPL